jgi:hypothetical protein
MQSRKWLLIGTLALAAAAASGWLIRTPADDPYPPSTPPPPSPALDVAAADAAVGGPGQADTPPVTALGPRAPGLSAAPRFDPAAFDRRALPDPKARLADVYEDLKRAAEAGNAVAACRLGTGLLDCRHAIEKDQRRIARVLDTTARHELPPAEGLTALAAEAAFAKRAAVVDASRGSMLHRCADLSPEMLAGAEDWLLGAMAKGNGHAIERFLLGFRLDSTSTLARPELVALFRDEAPLLAERAAIRGNLSTLGELVRAHAGLAPETALGMALPLDRVRARALALVYIEEAQGLARDVPDRPPDARAFDARERGRLLAMSSLGLTPEQTLAAQALARDLLDERERTRTAFREQVVNSGTYSYGSFEPCIR